MGECKGWGILFGQHQRIICIVEKDIGKLTAKVNPMTYTGKPVAIDASDITWKEGKKAPASEVTFEIIPSTYRKNVNKGTASVIVRGTGIYGRTKKVTFAIGTKKISWLQSIRNSLSTWF